MTAMRMTGAQLKVAAETWLCDGQSDQKKAQQVYSTAQALIGKPKRPSD